MADIPYVEVDYCQYAEWGYQKPTRIWGSPNVLSFKPLRCDGVSCPNLVEGSVHRKRHHRVRLSSPHQNLSSHLKYRIPKRLVLELIGEVPWPVRLVRTGVSGGFVFESMPVSPRSSPKLFRRLIVSTGGGRQRRL